MGKRISYETITPYVDSQQDRKSFLAGQLDTLKARGRLLSATDRVLMELLLQGQCKYVDLAVLMGVSESALSRRVQRLFDILGGRYSVGLRCRGQLSPLESKIERLAFLDGWTLSQIAGHTGLSFYRVRQIARKLKNRAATDYKITKRVQLRRTFNVRQNKRHATRHSEPLVGEESVLFSPAVGRP